MFIKNIKSSFLNLILLLEKFYSLLIKIFLLQQKSLKFHLNYDSFISSTYSLTFSFSQYVVWPKGLATDL